MTREWVLLRGLAREQGHWGEFKDLLQAADPQSTVTCIDLPGAGDFYRLASPMSMSGIADFVVSHMQTPKADQRLMVAISLGGMVASEIVNNHPKCIDGLVIINSSFKNLSPFYHRLQLEALKHIFKAATAANIFEKEKHILNMLTHRPDIEELAQEWAQMAQERPVSPLNFIKQLVAAATYELPEAVPQIPVLVLTSLGDTMVHHECSKQLAQAWHAPIEIHPSGGHELCLDAGPWVVEQCKKFFKF